MTLTDPIADMLIRIKNSSMRKRAICRLPFSKMNLSLVRILKREGVIEDFKTRKRENKRIIEVLLGYENGQPKFKDVKRISKPGRRVYEGYRKLRKFGRKGLLIISTPQGLMTGEEARFRKVGGEILAKINP